MVFMKRESLMLFSVVLASMILVAPVSAKNKVVYKAQGSWDEYLPPDPHAEILDGHWNIEIRMVGDEYVVVFHSHHRELNLGGEGAHEYDQAVGTVDHFKYYFAEVHNVTISGDTCVLGVDLMVHAKHHDPVTLRPYWHWLDYGFRVIVITEDHALTGTLSGTTHNIKY
jgi:hypothetical protein